jgi:hypothetical protein
LKSDALRLWSFKGDANWSTGERRTTDMNQLHIQFEVAFQRIVRELEGQGWRMETTVLGSVEDVPGMRGRSLRLYHLTRTM